MRKILITGANSYIGTSFEKYIKENFKGEYLVDTVDMVDGDWRKKSFAGYDSVFHVAGIAHQREKKKNAYLYYKINRDLAVETAQKAKADGVKQFVFLSSMSVYGMDEGVITKKTEPRPKTNYGKSKWQAEQGLLSLMDERFKVCILRPPIVYGMGCKGNFVRIKNIVERFPVFPYVKNKRSMIYIDNLSSFVKLCMDKEIAGLFYPQNREYVSTTEMARGIAVGLGKRVYFSRILGMVAVVVRMFLPMAKKAFGSLVYDNMEVFDFKYIVQENDSSFVDSVKENVCHELV